MLQIYCVVKSPLLSLFHGNNLLQRKCRNGLIKNMVEIIFIQQKKKGVTFSVSSLACFRGVSIEVSDNDRGGISIATDHITPFLPFLISLPSWEVLLFSLFSWYPSFSTIENSVWSNFFCLSRPTKKLEAMVSVFNQLIGWFLTDLRNLSSFFFGFATPSFLSLSTSQ